MARGKNILTGLVWEGNFRILRFLKQRLLVYFIFLSDGGVPKRRGARKKTSPFPSFDEPAYQQNVLHDVSVSKFQIPNFW